MINDFNLLATTMRGNERAMCKELLYLLKDELGDVDAQTSKTKIRGLVVAKTMLDPFKVMENFREILSERPYEFRYALRIIPIEQIIPTNLAEIKKAAKQFTDRIGINQSFRVTIEKRHTMLHSKDLIDVAVDGINRKVDLKNPDLILQLEIIGELTGISLIKPNDILAVIKEKLL
ncbi:MAG: THUMP domain-containing protein [Candidatus Bathyarchaeota archaeon]|nr:THUMP domain-containing protein [Candidatus Bathyarchaeota archaeon]MDD4325691.1 THUMP domain-containing protein [Candidatus Bathyarchaeota archaeon]MDT8782353.1 THUMP domain-containing protein [Candidatus Bathyarchaeota archaeon]